MNAVTTPTRGTLNQPPAQPRVEAKIPDGRDLTDRQGFLETGVFSEWKNTAEFRTPSGKVISLPPEIALNPRLFEQVMQAA